LTSRQAITSGGLEPVSDTGFAGNSVFSFFLLRKLKENKKTFLIPSDFFADVRAGVAENANQFPLFGTLKDTGGSEGGELVLFLKQEVRGDALNAELNVRKMEIERLNNLEKEATAARQKESDEIAKREKELSILDSRIEKARKSLGEVSLNNDNSLDSLLAMVRQKKDQEQKLEQLRVEKEEQELIRQKQIDELRKERNKKIIDMLSPEVEKYQEIVSSKYGHDLKSKAWKSLLAKCPTEWCKNINEGQYQLLLMPPDVRSKWLNLVSDKNNSYKALYKCYLQTTPNWGGAIVEIQEGELIVVVESIDEDGWVKANTLSGKEGYVHTKWLTK